ncbi:MAG: hypothetical protein WA658_13830, partial [Candidatus Acidiferrales bacterium]
MFWRASVIRTVILVVSVAAVCSLALGQDADSPAQRALAQADALANRQDFAAALAGYERADALSNHTCAECFLRVAAMHR